MPIARELEAQAADDVRLMPRNLNRQARFIVTVEFIDWNIAPEPHALVSLN